MQFSTTLRTNRATAISTALGAGGKIRIYSGSIPGVGNAITGQVLLAELTALGFNAAAAGAITFFATPDSSADAAGTPTFGRLLTSGDTPVVEFTAGVSSGEASFNNAISLGGTVTLSTATITEGNP